MIGLSAVVFSFIGMIAFTYLFFKYLFVCSHGNQHVEVKLFGVLTIFYVAFNDITYCDTALNTLSNLKMWSRINIQMTFSLNLNKRIFVVTKNSDVFAYTISPKNPEEFLRLLKSNLS